MKRSDLGIGYLLCTRTSGALSKRSPQTPSKKPTGQAQHVVRLHQSPNPFSPVQYVDNLYFNSTPGVHSWTNFFKSCSYGKVRATGGSCSGKLAELGMSSAGHAQHHPLELLPACMALRAPEVGLHAG